MCVYVGCEVYVCANAPCGVWSACVCVNAPCCAAGFHIVVCGLDSILARRWLNGMLVSLLGYHDDGQVDQATIVPMVDGGTEGDSFTATHLSPLTHTSPLATRTSPLSTHLHLTSLHSLTPHLSSLTPHLSPLTYTSPHPPLTPNLSPLTHPFLTPHSALYTI